MHTCNTHKLSNLHTKPTHDVALHKLHMKLTNLMSTKKYFLPIALIYYNWLL